MIDFKLDDHGDIVIKEAHAYNRFNIAFNPNKLDNCLRISFHTEVMNKEQRAPFAMTFYVSNKNENLKTVQTVRDIESKVQLIRIRAMTEYGELSNRADVGSDISKTRHGNLYDADHIETIRRYVVEMIKDLLTDYEVIVQPKNTEGNLYCHNMGVDIISEGKNIYSFTI